jgi:hypothetical protein
MPRVIQINAFNDSGHGWIKVPMSELIELRIAGQITTYSYRDGDVAYLEEDCDAATYINAAKAAGWCIAGGVSDYVEGRSTIRNLPRYHP